VSGETILSAENSGKPLGGRGRGSDPNPTGELTALPRPFGWWGGVAAHPQEPHPHSRPSTSIFYPSFLHAPMINPGHVLELMMILSVLTVIFQVNLG